MPAATSSVGRPAQSAAPTQQRPPVRSTSSSGNGGSGGSAGSPSSASSSGGSQSSAQDSEDLLRAQQENFDRLMEAAKTRSEAGEILVEAGFDRSDRLLAAAQKTDSALLFGEGQGSAPPARNKDNVALNNNKGENKNSGGGLNLLLGLLRAFG